ncbi:SBBP repeat-containing protein [Botryobacter ruber]|uniref:SBBP repeat-containing protein n=1 Tax=Botryobacter ruber TaxID=2171629 RepID=UPI000E0AA32E|nr:SBBP repeat-containing protein [Botryobacter ruber]
MLVKQLPAHIDLQKFFSSLSAIKQRLRMMKQLYRIFLLCFIGQLLGIIWASAQNPEIVWAKQAEGISENNPVTGRSVAHDASGNIYAIGHFTGVITIGNTSKTSDGSNDIFLAKYDASGNVLWVQKAGAEKNDMGMDIAVDNSGNVYITGFFSGTATFGSTTLYSNNEACIYIAKYDTAGNVIWAKKACGTTSVASKSIGVDGAGNIFVTGEFQDTVIFENTTLTSNGIADIFIARYDASGNIIWAQRAGGAGLDFSDNIAVDDLGNIFITGRISGTGTFGNITLTSNGASDIFIAKYDVTGNILWAKRAGGQGGDRGYGITLDASGNVYITGEFGGLATFDNRYLMSTNNSYDVFIAKYDAAGNIAWVQQAGGSDFELGRSIAVDGSGNVFVTGQFRGTATFENTTLTSSGDYDIFIARYSATGILQWAHRAGGTGSDVAFKIIVDGTGAPSILGQFIGIANFGDITLTGSNNPATFITKYNAFGKEQWAQKSSGYWSSDYGKSIAVDSDGNSYITGYFYGSATFGNTTLTSQDGYDIFIAKYDAAGNVLWAQRAGGLDVDDGLSIATDKAGNTYITGQFQGTASFGSTTLTSDGNTDIFIAKYDASGNVVWAKQAGGTGSDIANSIAVDGSGNTYITGRYSGTAVFGGITHTSNGNYDIFIVKYNTAGDFQWAQSAGGTGFENSYGVDVDGSGNAYLTGNFTGTAPFGNTVLSSTSGGTDIFIAKYDASGNGMWAQKVEGSHIDQGYDISVDNLGNFYITGFFNQSVTFGSTSLTGNSYNTFFIAKYDTAGNVQWAKKAEGTGSSIGYGITVDESGNAYVTGEFFDTAIFGNITLISAGNRDIFIAQYDAAGYVLWAQRIGGLEHEIAGGIAVDRYENAFLTGSFTETAAFGNVTLSSLGTEVFVMKISNAGTPTSISESKLATPLTIYPNPVHEKLQLKLPLTGKTNLELRLLDTNGRLLLKQNHTAVSGEFHHTLDLRDTPRGIYLLQLVTNQEVITRRIVKE